VNTLNRKEQEEKVIELYKQGKTVREIAKIVHLSFGPICSIIKKFTDEEARKKNIKSPSISEETKALQLFSQGKSPIEVRIALDISTEEVERLYNDHWRLKWLHQLHRYYETEIKKDFPSFLKLYAKVRD